MATVRVGKSEPKASAAFKISRRGVADLSAEPLQLSVGGEEVLQPDTEGESVCSGRMCPGKTAI